MLTGRFSHRVYIAYSIVYCVGTILSMQIPFVGFQPVQSSEHMAALGVFGLCQLFSFYEYTRSKLSAEQFQSLFKSLTIFVGGIALAAGIVLSITGSMYIYI